MYHFHISSPPAASQLCLEKQLDRPCPNLKRICHKKCKNYFCSFVKVMCHFLKFLTPGSHCIQLRNSPTPEPVIFTHRFLYILNKQDKCLVKQLQKCQQIDFFTFDRARLAVSPFFSLYAKLRCLDTGHILGDRHPSGISLLI